MGKWRHHT